MADGSSARFEDEGTGGIPGARPTGGLEGAVAATNVSLNQAMEDERILEEQLRLKRDNIRLLEQQQRKENAALVTDPNIARATQYLEREAAEAFDLSPTRKRVYETLAKVGINAYRWDIQRRCVRMDREINTLDRSVRGYKERMHKKEDEDPNTDIRAKSFYAQREAYAQRCRSLNDAIEMLESDIGDLAAKRDEMGNKAAQLRTQKTAEQDPKTKERLGELAKSYAAKGRQLEKEIADARMVLKQYERDLVRFDMRYTTADAIYRNDDVNVIVGEWQIDRARCSLDQMKQYVETCKEAISLSEYQQRIQYMGKTADQTEGAVEIMHVKTVAALRENTRQMQNQFGKSRTSRHVQDLETVGAELSVSKRTGVVQDLMDKWRSDRYAA